MGEGEETPAPLRLIGGNAKSLRLKSGLEKVFAVAVIFLRPPPLLSHCPGALEQLCSPIQSLKVLQCMVSNTTQHPLSPPHTLQYIALYTDKKENLIFLIYKEWSSCKVIYEEGLPNI